MSEAFKVICSLLQLPFTKETNEPAKVFQKICAVLDILRSYRTIDFAGCWWYYETTKGDDQWSALSVEFGKYNYLAKSSLVGVAVLLFYSNRNGILTNMYRYPRLARGCTVLAG